ncbi:MAG: acyl carrier protein [Bacteroidales bacterium]|nr:acyl carrier protein [Bacteroidales bacterium]
MEELILKLKEQIIEALNLEDMEPDEIDTEEPLFGDGLGLDSIDALELIVLLEKNYGIKIENPKDGQKIFFSVKTLAEYINEHQKN